jgi:Domain of unknown function (DUF4157)/L,D-transpeptidase catalytic domain
MSGSRAASVRAERPAATAPVYMLRRKCSCGQHSVGATCAACASKQTGLRRRFVNEQGETLTARADSLLQTVLGSPGSALDGETQTEMGARFGYDFSGVRVHADTTAAHSAKAVKARAYTAGHHVVFGSGQYAPQSRAGRHLLAHELTHVVQQGTGPASGLRRATGLSESVATEAEADAAADAVLADRPVGSVSRAVAGIQRRAEPYIKKVTVHLTPPQTAELQWQGTAPASATGSDSFTVSTGKGYSDPIDDPGTCTRACCSDAMTQCAPPWNQPNRVGACCTYIGNTFWTGTPSPETNGWKWWTPIQPYYSSRGIALHQHDTVTGQPIGHGCVRMDEPNAKRIYDFSNGRQTNVTIDGRAAPVACDQTRQCAGAGTGQGSGATSQRGAAQDVDAAALAQQPAIPGMEGVMT